MFYLSDMRYQILSKIDIVSIVSKFYEQIDFLQVLWSFTVFKGIVVAISSGFSWLIKWYVIFITVTLKPFSDKEWTYIYFQDTTENKL